MTKKAAPKGSTEPETRARILQAAEDLFANRGYSGASIKAIATEAGVTGAMIHYYFQSKEKLYHTVLDGIVEDFETMAREIVSTGKPPVERLEIYFSWTLDYAAKHPNLARLTVMGLGGSESAYFERMVKRSLRPLFARGIGFVEDGVEAGLLQPIDPTHLLLAMYGTILTYFADQKFFSQLVGKNVSSKAELEKHKQTVLDILFRTLGMERPKGSSSQRSSL